MVVKEKPNRITGEMVYDALKKLVKRAGKGFVYSPPLGGDTCVYVYNGRGSCAVGRVLINNFGFKVADLKPFDLDPHSATQLPFGELTDAAKKVLLYFQALQDAAIPYGQCLSSLQESIAATPETYRDEHRRGD